MAVALDAVVHQAVESSAGDLWELGQFLWGNPEISMEEATAHDRLSEFLERKGFKVTRRYLLDTAFRAEFCAPGGIDGPTIAFLAEYDALPEIGHACGHNLVSECALGAAVAVKEVMQKFKNIRGKILVLGTPGQENFGGKEVLLQKNAFKDTDAVLLAHPAVFNCANTPLAARQKITVQFQSSAHCADSPWETASALDAAVTSYVNLALFRQQVKPASRILGMLLESSRNDTAVPETSRLMYQVSAPTMGELAVLMGRVEACFEAAAQATGCSLVQEKGIVYKEFVHNKAFIDAYSKHARDMGVLFGEADEGLVTPAASSSDSGNVSQALPCLQASFAIASAGANHSRTFAAAAGSREAQTPTRRAAKILALTSLDLYTDPKLLARVKQEFQEWKNRQQQQQQLDRKESKQPAGS